MPPFTQFISYAEFKSDGTYHSWGALGVAHETWKLKGKTVTTYVHGEVNFTFTDLSMKGDEMSGVMNQSTDSMPFKAKRL